MESQHNNTFAVLDLGSNSFHLIIARVSNDVVQPIVRDKKLVSLASGLDKKNKLSAIAMQRGIEVLRQFAQTIGSIDPQRVRVIATHTLRQAKNRAKFLKLSRQVMPFPIEIISGEEEARLIYQGVAQNSHLVHSMAKHKNLIIDIGGGSTEFAIGKGFETLHLSSVNMGVLTYCQRYFLDGEVTEQRMQKAKNTASRRLQRFVPHLQKMSWDQVIGTSSTFRLIACYLREDSPATELTIDREHLQKVWNKIVTIKNVELLQLEEADRQRVFPAGVAILSAIFEQLDIELLTFCDCALREGTIYELAQVETPADVQKRTISALNGHYNIDTQQADRVVTTAQQLFDQVKSHYVYRIESRNYLMWCAALLEIGASINSKKMQKHSSYIIKNIHMPGFSRGSQKLMSYLVGHYRKKLPYELELRSAVFSQVELKQLIVLLRLSYLLNVRRIANFVPAIKITFVIDGSTLQVLCAFPKCWLQHNQLVEDDLAVEIDQLQPMGIYLKIRNYS